MKPLYRVLLAAAALLLLPLYRMPLWHIDLKAPQYPEGLGLRIYLWDVRGKGPHDLPNINTLNHYIGMRPIEPDAIPELRYMPWIVAGLIALGLGAALIGRRWAALLWVGVFAVTAALGLYDFWRWGYEYGHNLDPNAPIQIPGMAYQPPLIGSKQLLNITATSLPGPGGWLAIASLLLALCVLGCDIREAQRGRTPASRAVPVALVLIFLGSGCSEGPRPIRIGEDTCVYCRMTIADDRYGAELLTRKGRLYTFDSIECLAAFLLHGQVPEQEVRSRWVVDFSRPGALLPVEGAYFLHSERLGSPMGLGISAFSRPEDRDAMLQRYGGRPLERWDEILALVRGSTWYGKSL